MFDPAAPRTWAAVACVVAVLAGGIIAGSEVTIRDRSGGVRAIVRNADAVPRASIEAAPPQLPGWPFATGDVNSTPTVGDVDGDGDLEVAFTSSDAKLHLLDAQGVPVAGWPVALAQGFGTAATPALADVDGVAGAEIFSGESELLGLRHDATSLPGWPQPGSRIFSTPIVEDLDHDGVLEIAATDEGHARLWQSTGVPKDGWPFSFPNPALTGVGPAAGNLDGSAPWEIAVPVAASEFDPGLYAFDLDAAVLPGYPQTFRGGVRAGVSIADMSANGMDEVIFQEPEGIWVLGEEGGPLPGWPVDPDSQNRTGNAAPAIGDIDRDGQLELVWGTVGGDGKVFAYRHDGTMQPGWPVTVPLFTFNAQATLGDVDGDGGVDIVLGGQTATFGSIGRIYAWHADGTPVAGFPFDLPDGKTVFQSAVTITDLDLDGDVDLLVGTDTGFGGTDNGKVFAFDLEAPYDPTTLEWPTLGHDVRHTRRYVPPPRKVGVAVSPPVLSLDRPPAVVTARAILPEDLQALQPRLVLSSIERRPVHLDGMPVGPVSGERRLFQFEGAALAQLIRDTLDPVPEAVRLEFSTQTEPLLLGSTSVAVR